MTRDIKVCDVVAGAEDARAKRFEKRQDMPCVGRSELSSYCIRGLDEWNLRS